MSDEKKMYQYSTPLSDGFNMWLAGKHMHAVNKVLTVNEEQHKEIQALIDDGRHDVACNLKLIDTEAAEKIAKAHMATVKPVATKGPAGSQILKPNKEPEAPKPVNVKIPPAVTNSLMARLKGNADQIRAEAAATPDAPLVEGAVHNEDLIVK